MKIYNKLVRDKIPEIIAKEGKECITRILDEKEYKKELLKKLVEEATEASLAGGNDSELVKEIGDLEEVMDSVIEAFWLDRDDIDEVRSERRKSRGGFKKKIFLESSE